jgi:hypothetical protein
MVHYPVTGVQRHRESYIAIDVIRISDQSDWAGLAEIIRARDRDDNVRQQPIKKGWWY